MRPTLRFLEDRLIERILGEAREILCKLGVEIHNPKVLGLLAEQGAQIEKTNCRAYFTESMIDKALKTVPKSVKLYDTLGNQTHDLTGMNVYFNPGSAAIKILDCHTGEARKPTTEDYVRYTKLMSKLDHIAAQSTALIPGDVHEKISDSYRLYLSLLFCEKPVVTGAFTIESFEIMKDLQVVIRSSEAALREKPLTIFSCCPTAPIKWSDVTSQNLVDCALYGIPVEFISMPLSGFMAPVTLVGTLIQHTAETLSGIVISQAANPGAPVLYGGSPAIFDVRYETTPMGAIETIMIDCAYNEIGKFLGIPTQAYISLSDAKCLDIQAGMETGIGAVLATLSGINSISGPGMLDFESCQSLEKLVMDNEICGMALRMVKGIEPKDDFPSLGLFQELLKEKHLLIAKHTRRYLKEEQYVPGPVIDRANQARWKEEGCKSSQARAKEEVERLLDEYKGVRVSQDKLDAMTKLMKKEAKRYGMDHLPRI